MKTLIIGYGNPDRNDDGVAFFIIKALRQRLRQKTPDMYETELEGLGGPCDSVFLRQLTPELTDAVTAYHRLVFVDAHVIENAPELSCERVFPKYESSPFTHHITPAMFLALLKTLCNKEPEDYLISVRGYNFDFCQGLSPNAEKLVELAAEMILRLLKPQFGKYYKKRKHRFKKMRIT